MYPRYNLMEDIVGSERALGNRPEAQFRSPMDGHSRAPFTVALEKGNRADRAREPGFRPVGLGAATSAFSIG